MQTVPLSYIARNLWVRRVTTLLTALGMGLVVYVFATVLMMSEGIRHTLVATGQSENVMVLRKGAGAEINSGITREQAALMETLPGIATDGAGRPIVSREPVILTSLTKLSTGRPANVTLRGTTPIALSLRPQVQLSQGRFFKPGSSEVVVGKQIAAGFEGVQLGATLRFGGRDWTVVGLFDAQRSAFDSEVWADSETLLAAFRRSQYSSVVLRLAASDGFERIKPLIEGDPRLTLEPKPEIKFYAEQSEALATFISYLGTALAIIFSIGAIVGATITMFGSVASRIGEIGTLRALGFRRGAVLIAFLGEALLLALVGGVLGLIGASLMQTVDFSTTNFTTFSELSFQFKLTPRIATHAVLFALFMGFVGGFIPAWRASRMKIVDCLRAA